MVDADLADGDLTNEVKINLNVLFALVLYAIDGEVDEANVIAVDKRALCASVFVNRIKHRLKMVSSPALGVCLDCYIRLPSIDVPLKFGHYLDWNQSLKSQ
jgi:hypothetical protein